MRMYRYVSVYVRADSYLSPACSAPSLMDRSVKCMQFLFSIQQGHSRNNSMIRKGAIRQYVRYSPIFAIRKMLAAR
jgi:hypothetical protein